MRRLRVSYVLVFLILVGAVAGCQVLHLDSARLGGASWPTEGKSPLRRHEVPEELAPPLEQVWTYDTDAGFVAAAPLLLQDVVLVATQEGDVQTIHLEDGDDLSTGEFGEAVEGTPALKDDLLFVPVAQGDKAVVAYDLDRAEAEWTAEGPPVEAGLLSLEGLLVAADMQGNVIARESRSGREQWRRASQDKVPVFAAPLSLDGENVLVADAEGAVRMLARRSGSLQWEKNLAAPVYVTPAANDSTVFLSTTRGRLIALDAASGAVRWQHALSDTTVRFASPAVSGQRIIVGASDGRLRALDPASGRLLWTFDAGEALSAPPLITRSHVYVGSMGGKLFGLDAATGEKKWETELQGPIKSAMASQGNRLVVVSEPDVVYLFQSTDEERYAERN